jgi:hypothetical protein
MQRIKDVTLVPSHSIQLQPETFPGSEFSATFDPRPIPLLAEPVLQIMWKNIFLNLIVLRQLFFAFFQRGMRRLAPLSTTYTKVSSG